MIQNDSKCVTAAPQKFMLMLLRRSVFIMHVSSGPHTYIKHTDMNMYIVHGGMMMLIVFRP